MLNKIMNFDRRVLFILVAVAVIVPTILQPRLPIVVSAPTQNVYDYIEALPPGSTVMMSFDYGPSSMPEPTAVAKAVLRHCFTKGLKVIGMTLEIEGVPLADATIKEIAEEKGVVEGEDYVYLGFRPGNAVVILGMGLDIARVFETDYANNPVADIPLMQQITNYNEIDLMIVLASGETAETWITYAHTKYGLKIAAGTTAVITTQLYPFLQTGQLVGLLNGYLGAAEYEQLTGELAEGTIGINNATAVHLLIIVLVILGNIIYFIQHRRQKHLTETTA